MRPSSALSCVLALAAVCSIGSLRAQDEQDVLPPQQAYPYTLEADADHLSFDFSLRDGYYLYRDRFGFESKTEGVTLAPAQFPAGQIHEDEFFGKQEIYRGHFQILVPYSGKSAAGRLDVVLSLQGCADIGLCYPPQHWDASVELPAGSILAGSQAASVILGGGDEQLPVDQAFVMNARFDAANELTVGWQIQPGYYLYRDKLAFSADGDIELGTPRLPEGKAHHDDNFGDVQVFYDYVEAVIPFSRASPDEIPVTIHADFQGCKEDSICYPPSEQTMALNVPPSSAFTGAGTAREPNVPSAPVSEQDRLAGIVLGDSWLIVLGTFYGLGLLLAFTPCVLPMVPILSSIIAGQNATTTARAFALSASYVGGMAVTYTVGGALAALAGAQIQAVFQKPWIITVFAALFVVLALGMFGLFQLQMPATIQSRLAGMANRQKAGSFVGTAIMGALSALIVTTCVAPPLVATLAVIGQNGDVTRGAAALFALSLGMGSPLLLVGASAGKLLPKAGPWMNAVKAAFGVMMLAVAIWMLDRVLPGTVTLVLWALLVFLTGVFLGAFEPLPAEPSPTRRLSKGLGVLACLYGALMLIGATLGGEDPLKPLPQGGLLARGAGQTSRAGPAFQSVETLAQLQTALAAARAESRPVMIDFTADWCVSCKEMERYTFPEQSVVDALKPFVLLRADVTANDDGDKALLKYFNSYGPPTIAFFDAHGNQQEPYKLVGYVPAEEFAAHVTRLAAL